MKRHHDLTEMVPSIGWTFPWKDAFSKEASREDKKIRGIIDKMPCHVTCTVIYKRIDMMDAPNPYNILFRDLYATLESRESNMVKLIEYSIEHDGTKNIMKHALFKNNDVLLHYHDGKMMNVPNESSISFHVGKEVDKMIGKFGHIGFNVDTVAQVYKWRMYDEINVGYINLMHWVRHFDLLSYINQNDFSRDCTDDKKKYNF